jgi:hypothetical protein
VVIIIIVLPVQIGKKEEEEEEEEETRDTNHLEGIGSPVIRTCDQEICFPVVLSLSLVVANIMIIGGLHGR